MGVHILTSRHLCTVGSMFASNLKRRNYWCVKWILTRPAVNIVVIGIDILRVRYNYPRDRISIVRSLWLHQQLIVPSSAERKLSKWDTGTMCKDRCFHRELWIRYVAFYFGFYFPRCFATRKMNIKITLSWPPKQFINRIHTLFCISSATVRVRYTTTIFLSLQLWCFLYHTFS